MIEVSNGYIVHCITLKFSISNVLLLVDRNKINLLILYSTTLLNLLIYFSKLFMYSLGFSTDKVISSVKTIMK